MKQIQPGNHIDQLIRQTRVHHVQLSMMADTKTSMLLTISSIVLTLSFSKLTEASYRTAAAILVFSSVITVVLCCLTVMPSLKKKFKGQRARNFLFFNDFAEMSFEDYQNEMHSLMIDPTQCYEAQVKEIYQMGQYLYRKKYPLLRLAYIAFFSGFILAAAQLLISLY